MKSPSVGDMFAGMYKMVSNATPEDRMNAITALCAAFGEQVPSIAKATTGSQGGARPTGNASSYFERKGPINKGEELAVAARYLEETGKGDRHSREDLKTVILEARRNFDGNNFTRDIGNAQRQAGFFMAGGDKGYYQLSYVGQNYVDKLPNRDEAKKAKRAKKTRSKKVAQ